MSRLEAEPVVIIRSSCCILYVYFCIKGQTNATFTPAYKGEKKALASALSPSFPLLPFTGLELLQLFPFLRRSPWSTETTPEPWSLCEFTPWSSRCSTSQTSPWRRSDATWWRRWWRWSFPPSTWTTRPSTISCRAGSSLWAAHRWVGTEPHGGGQWISVWAEVDVFVIVSSERCRTHGA